LRDTASSTPADHRVGHVDGVLAGLFRDGDRHRGEFPAARSFGAAVPHVTFGRRRAVLHLGYLAKEHRPALMHAHHQLAHFLGAGKERPGFHGDGGISLHQFPRRQAGVGRTQGGVEILDGDAAAGHLRRIEAYEHGPSGPADRLHLARARYPLELDLHAVSDAFEIECPLLRVGGVERERDDRHVVDAFWFDDRLEHAQVAR
jgi:hypothetical protein